MNKIRSQQEEPKAQEVKSPKRSGDAGSNPASRIIKALNVFNLFNRESVVNYMPFVMFLVMLAMFYIWNTYTVEKTVREIDKTEKELKELRSEFITGKSELMYKSKLSEVANTIKNYGLKESTVAPKKIVVRKPKEQGE